LDENFQKKREENYQKTIERMEKENYQKEIERERMEKEKLQRETFGNGDGYFAITCRFLSTRTIQVNSGFRCD
jgi:hypothetical protein